MQHHRLTKNWPFCVSISNKFNIKTMMATPNDLYLVFAWDNFRWIQKNGRQVCVLCGQCEWTKQTRTPCSMALSDCAPRLKSMFILLIIQCKVFPRQNSCSIRMHNAIKFKCASTVDLKARKMLDINFVYSFVLFYFRKYPAVKFQLMSGSSWNNLKMQPF